MSGSQAPHESQIDIPTTMDRTVQALGGIVYDDFDNSANKPKNADYWFPSDHVVAELKCWTEDLSTKTKFQDDLKKLCDSWVAQGLMAPLRPGVNRFRVSEIPGACALEFMSVIKERVESHVREAAKQIKTTRNLLDPAAKGLLLLANDGSPLLSIDGVANVLHHILKTQHSSINTVLYFSANERIVVPGVDQPSAFWCPMQIEGREPVDRSFLARLADQWFRKVRDQLGGDPLTVMTVGSMPELVNRIAFENKPGWHRR